MDSERGLHGGARSSARRRSPTCAGCRYPTKGEVVDHKTSTHREALGRFRGGLSTKIHLVADRRCRPLARILSPGQHGDSPYFQRVLNTIRIVRRGLGRPRRRPATVLADKAYSSRSNRATCAGVASRRSSRSRRISRSTASSGAVKAGVRPSSMPSGTRSATPSSGASASSGATGLWPYALTNASASTKAPSTSPRSSARYAWPPSL
ncbi:transposase [Planotetraspora mira]|uniref:transposase n=1 Tax=Planotetraspora mira TaxID=58121 RepID=UPI0035713D70